MISLVQQAVGSATSGTSFTVTLGGAPTAGNNQFCVFGGLSGTTGSPTPQSIASIVQTGCTWALLTVIVPAQGQDLEIWMGTQIQAGAGAVATINTNGVITDAEANVSEWAEVDETAPDNPIPYPQANTWWEKDANSSSVSAMPSNYVNTVSQVLIIAAYRNNISRTITGGPTNGFTALSSADPTLTGAAYLITDHVYPSTPPGITTGWTLSGSSGWVTWFVAFRWNPYDAAPGDPGSLSIRPASHW